MNGSKMADPVQVWSGLPRRGSFSGVMSALCWNSPWDPSLSDGTKLISWSHHRKQKCAFSVWWRGNWIISHSTSFLYPVLYPVGTGLCSVRSTGTMWVCLLITSAYEAIHTEKPTLVPVELWTPLPWQLKYMGGVALKYNVMILGVSNLHGGPWY